MALWLLAVTTQGHRGDFDLTDRPLETKAGPHFDMLQTPHGSKSLAEIGSLLDQGLKWFFMVCIFYIYLIGPFSPNLKSKCLRTHYCDICSCLGSLHGQKSVDRLKEIVHAKPPQFVELSRSSRCLQSKLKVSMKRILEQMLPKQQSARILKTQEPPSHSAPETVE